MQTQLGFLTDKSDPILLDFLDDRRRLMARATVFLTLAAVVMLWIGDWNVWPVPIIIALLVIQLWRDYRRLATRVRRGGFGDDQMDYELLEGYFKGSGIKTEVPSLD